MNKVTEEIIQKKRVVDADGKEYPLHSETSVEQSEFLKKLVADSDASVCVEIGLAYGISSLFIAEAISKKSAPRFISIDPFQQEWHDIGLLNLKRAGYGNFVEFYREFSHEVLPRLLASGTRVDFAYVDTSKVFDVVLTDAYYLTRLLRVGGVLAFDDCNLPGVARVARCIAKWPHLTIADKTGLFESPWKRKVLSRALKALPQKERIFSDSILTLDEELGTNARCIAFRKTSEDTRNWDWYSDF